MKTQNLLLFITCLVLLSGCAWFEESEIEKINGTFYCGWSDLKSNRSIIRQIDETGNNYSGVIPCYVSAFGNKGNYIIAKQHSNHTSEINYYILDTLKYDGNKRGLYGPMNESDFNKLKEGLKITDINFSKTYKENP